MEECTGELEESAGTFQFGKQNISVEERAGLSASNNGKGLDVGAVRNDGRNLLVPTSGN